MFVGSPQSARRRHKGHNHSLSTVSEISISQQFSRKAVTKAPMGEKHYGKQLRIMRLDPSGQTVK